MMRRLNLPMTRNNRTKESTAAVRIITAIIFCIFTFLYVYCYHTDTLAYAQHVLSDGVTVYHPLPSALLITLLAFIIQRLVQAVTHLYGLCHSLTYAPSFIMLAFMASVYVNDNGQLSIYSWVYFIPLILILYFVVIRILNQGLTLPASPYPLYASRELTVNMLLLIIMMTCTLNISNGNPLFHRQIRAERQLLMKDYDALAHEGQAYESPLAAHFGGSSAYSSETVLTTDTTLTVLRAIALDRRGVIADSLFSQPVEGSVESFMQLKGVRPLMCSKRFLMRHKSQDYRLCALLAGRDLDRFAKRLADIADVENSTAKDSLPRHYREALIVYQHMRSKPITQYRDSVLEADYKDMRELLQKRTSDAYRQHVLWQNYRNTYWHYFFKTMYK